MIGVSRGTGSDVCLGRVGGRLHNLVERPQINNSSKSQKSESIEFDSDSAPSLLVELGSDVAARGKPPRFAPLCRKATMLHAATVVWTAQCARFGE